MYAISFPTLGGDKVSALTNTYSHKPLRKIKLAIYTHPFDKIAIVNLWPDVCSGDLQA